MNSIIQLLAELAAKDIRLWVEESKLRFSAPEGALTPAIRDRIVAQKAAIIEFIEQAGKQQQINIPHHNRNARLAASFAQQRLWFLNRLDPQSPAYNMSGALRLQGQLNIDALNRALTEIVTRHEVLRTSYIEDDAGLALQINAAQQLTIDVQPLPATLHGSVDTIIETLAQREASRPFDLTRDDVLRVTLYRIADTDYLLLPTLHHIASDGWSMGVLVAELAALYGAFYENKSSPLPELPLQYTDYAGWQRDWLTGERLENQLKFWRDTLSATPILQLPTDRPRAATTGSRGDSVWFELDSELTRELNQLARQQNATLFMVLSAALRVLLSRYSGQTDFGIGTPVAGRPQSQLEALIGCFVNTVAIRNDIDAGATFAVALQAEKNAAQAAFDHQDVPFEQVVDALKLPRDMAFTPLFQVMLVLQNTPVNYDTRIPGLTIQPVELKKHAAMFDLKFSLNEVNARMVAEIEYRAELWDVDSMRALSNSFVTLLRAIVSDPTRIIAQYPLLTSTEMASLLSTSGDSWNATQRELPAVNALHTLIEQQVERTPDHVAVSFENAHWNYRELNARANQLAHHLRSLGVGAGSLVGVCLERSLDMSLALLATLKAGAAYVPFDPTFPADRLGFMLEDTDVSVILTATHLKSVLPTQPQHVLCLDHDATQWQSQSDSNPNVDVKSDNLFNVIFTSGSTGKPKGVMVPQIGIINRLLWMQDRYPLAAGNRVLQKTPYSFDVSVWELFWPLLVGAEIVYAKPEGHKDPDYLCALTQQQRIDTLHFVPSMLGIFLQNDNVGACTSIRRVFCSGEALQLAHEKRFFEKLPRAELHNLYGPTEASVDVSYYPCSPNSPYRSVPIGKPVWNTQLHVLDTKLQPVPVGVVGELYIGGIQLAHGYLKRDELTRTTFIDNPHHHPINGASGHPSKKLYKTGDLARYLPDGNIEYIGRVDFQVKVRGLRIELGEIETVLMRHPQVKEALVVVTELSAGNVIIVAYFVVQEGVARDQNATPDASALRAFLQRDLPQYMIPNVFMALDEIPLSANGKANRKALPAPDLTQMARAGYVAPRNATEQAIADIFADILGLERVGINDSFFELGGHSLLATQVVSRLRNLTNRELPLRAMFVDPTVAGIALALDAQQFDAAPPLVAIDPRPAQIPLSFAQQRLWLVDQLIPGNAAYHMPAALTLRGALDQSALQRAIGDVIARHEILRTVFVRDIDSNPWQRIDAFHGFALETRDLRTLDAATRDSNVLEQAKEIAWQAFDLAVGPLLRTCLLATGSDTHVLLLNMHHIISDGWSLGILVQEIAASYHAHRNGIATALPPLSVQYADFAIWQRNWLSGDVLQRQLDFWKQALRNAPTLELPLDFPRPRAINTAAGEVDFTVPTTTANALQRLAQRQGATLFMALEAVLATLLARHSGQDDICVGSTIANRNRIETEPLIGFFVNTLVIRNDFSARPDFNTLLRQVRDFTLAAYDHQDIPFEQIVEHVGVQRQLDRTPLFQVLLSLQNNPLPSRIEQPGLAIEQLDTGAHPAKFDLSVHIAPENEALAVTLRYRSDLFTSQRMQKFAEQFQRLLDLIIDNPNAALDSLPLIDALQQQTLASWNNNAKTFANRELTIDHIIATAATTYPQHIAVVAGGEQINYGELNQRANQLAHYLRANGAKPDSVVAILMERCTDAIVAMLGILKAGAAYTFIDHEYPPERIAHIVDIAQPLIVLTDTALRSRLDISVNSLAREDFATLLGTQPDTDPGTVVTPDNLAYVVFTSGSTGLPKGVAIEHRNLTNYIAAVRERLQLPAHASHASVSTLAADLGNTVLYHALADAGTLHLIDKQTALSGAQFAAYNKEHRIDSLKIVPSHLRALLDCADPAAILPQRCLVLGGEALHRDLVQNLRALKPACRIVNHYGPSETTVGVACAVLDDDHANRAGMPIGRAFANVSLHIVNHELQPQPIGIPGELLIGGAQVGRGYLNRDDLTIERFIDNPFGAGRLYRSGDLARFLDNGEVQILGRIDRQVKLRGFRIELAEIEAAIAQLPQVGNAAVKLVSRNGNDMLVAYLAGEALTQPQLRAALRDKLPDYMVPSVVMMLDALPLNANGKVDYHALPALTAEHFNDREHVAPRNDTERYLAGLWQDILGLERIGIDDNFFEIGGHSLAATRVIARAQQQYTVELDLRSMFEQPTIAVIGAAIDAALLERALIIDSNNMDVTSDDDEEMVL